MKLTKDDKEIILLLIDLRLTDKDIKYFNVNKYLKLRNKIKNDLK